MERDTIIALGIDETTADAMIELARKAHIATGGRIGYNEVIGALVYHRLKSKQIVFRMS